MASLSSSVVNKSTKKFAPKARERKRPDAVTASATSSSAAVVEVGQQQDAPLPTPPATQPDRDEPASNATPGQEDASTHTPKKSAASRRKPRAPAQRQQQRQPSPGAAPEERPTKRRKVTFETPPDHNEAREQDQQRPGRATRSSRAALQTSSAPSPQPDGQDTQPPASPGRTPLKKAPIPRPRRGAQRDQPVDSTPSESVPAPPEAPSNTRQSRAPRAPPRRNNKSAANVPAIQNGAADTNRDSAVGEQAQPAPKQQKGRRGRKSTSDVQEPSVPADEEPAAAQPSKKRKPRASRRQKDHPSAEVVVDSDQENRNIDPAIQSTEADGEQQPPKTRQSRKRKAKEPVVNGSTAAPAESVEPADDDEQEDDGTPKKKRKRAATPEELRNHEIDVSTTLVGELTANNRKGKKSKLEEKMQSIDWAEVRRRRKQDEADRVARAMNGGDESASEAEEHPAGEDDEEAAEDNSDDDEPRTRGPQLKIVNGEMVFDTEAAPREELGPLDEGDVVTIEGQDVTAHLTTHSFIYRNRRDPVERARNSNKADPWTEVETEAFYEALRGFGTDFFLISQMFPGKTRNHVKRKFVREEKSDPERVKRALINDSVEMDMDTFLSAAQRTHADYRDPEELEEELRRARDEQREQIERERLEREERDRKRQEKAREKAEAQVKGQKKKRERKSKKSKKAAAENDADGQADAGAQEAVEADANE